MKHNPGDKTRAMLTETAPPPSWSLELTTGCLALCLSSDRNALCALTSHVVCLPRPVITSLAARSAACVWRSVPCVGHQWRIGSKLTFD
mmetsp:Transcript_23750/g.51528  ORF Transcript_23750/g.51528 Transcript_23750/m.51528 type:complete len:89 (+) Transcript_23750:161-427(+)